MLQELDPDEIHVADSEDVRCRLITELNVYNSNSVRNSRLELVDSILRGTSRSSSGCSTPFSCWPTQGEAALSVFDQSRVHLVRTDFLGGSSSWLNCEWTPGPDGAPGIYATDSSEVILTGDQHIARGGDGGINCFYSQDCSYTGSAASGVFVSGELWHSGIKFEPGTTWGGPNCTIQVEPPVAGSTVYALAELDPTLSLEGTPAAGTTVKFVVRGPAGADVLLYLGRKPVVLTTPGIRVELLTPMNVNWPLGVITATKLERSYKIRPLPPRYTFYAQAVLTYSTGEVRRSNSIPIIVR